jgi:hypothetical protein
MKVERLGECVDLRKKEPRRVGGGGATRGKKKKNLDVVKNGVSTTRVTAYDQSARVFKIQVPWSEKSLKYLCLYELTT